MELKALFANQNMRISGGNSTKRHMFSPVQARLSLFLLALNELSPHATVKSFHHSNSSQIRNNLEAQLEWMDKNNMLKGLINNETSLEQLKAKVRELDNGASLNSSFNKRN